MNREIFPNAVYPLAGDVTSQAGNRNVSVVGLRNIPIQSVFLAGGEVLTYDVNSNQWTSRIRANIQVNNLTVSDDNYVTVNVTKEIKVNGA